MNHTYRLIVMLGLFALLALLSCKMKRTTESSVIASFDTANVQLAFHTVQIQNHVVRFAITGSKDLPSLVFVHGSPGDWTAYERYMKDETLLAHFRIVSIDRPGYGGSDKGHPMHLTSQVELVSRAIEQIKNDQPMYWIGHSLGGPFVVLMAMRHKELVSGLTILSGSVNPADEAPERWRKIFHQPFLKFFIPVNLSTSNEEIMFFKKDIDALENDWNKIECPVLIVHGVNDPLVPFSNAPYAMEQLTKSSQKKMVPIEGANHFIPWEHFDTIKMHLLEFFYVDD